MVMVGYMINLITNHNHFSLRRRLWEESLQVFRRRM